MSDFQGNPAVPLLGCHQNEIYPGVSYLYVRYEIIQKMKGMEYIIQTIQEKAIRKPQTR